MYCLLKVNVMFAAAAATDFSQNFLQILKSFTKKEIFFIPTKG